MPERTDMEIMERMEGDVLDIHNEFGTYGEYKAEVDRELQRSAESFVRIGYLLKVARDTDILAESGYRSVNEFAEAEYSLDKSQVSRFIRINDEFSEKGYSDRLQERYQSFGHAKLALMLLLPAAVNEELTAGYTKAEINTIKEEIDEEKKRTDLEVMMEEKDSRQQSFGAFGKALHEIGKGDPELYLKLYEAVGETVYDGTIRPVVDKLAEALAPAGEAVITLRIAGEGKKMLSIKGADADPVLVDIRFGEKISCTWDDFIDEAEHLCGGESGRSSWEELYGEPFPEEKEKVAPVQPQSGAPDKQERRKPGRVRTVSAEQNGRDAGEHDQEIEGQMDISMYPQYLPESCSVDRTAENDDSGVNLKAGREGLEQHISNQSEIIIGILDLMKQRCEERDWNGLIDKAGDVITRAESIKGMMDVLKNE